MLNVKLNPRILSPISFFAISIRVSTYYWSVRRPAKNRSRVAVKRENKALALQMFHRRVKAVVFREERKQYFWLDFLPTFSSRKK